MRERVCMQCRGQFVTQVTTVAPKGLTIKAALRYLLCPRAYDPGGSRARPEPSGGLGALPGRQGVVALMRAEEGSSTRETSEA